MQAAGRLLSNKMSLAKEHLKEFNGTFPEETEELNSPCCSKLQEYRYNCASTLVMLKTDLLAKKTKLITIGLQMYVILLILHFFLILHHKKTN